MMLVTLRSHQPAPDSMLVDPEMAYRTAMNIGWPESVAASWAAWCVGLPVAKGEDGVFAWTIREVRQLRSLAIEYAMGGWPQDRDDR